MYNFLKVLCIWKGPGEIVGADMARQLCHLRPDSTTCGGRGERTVYLMYIVPPKYTIHVVSSTFFVYALYYYH